MILDPLQLEDFCSDFVHRLEKYKLSYYLRDRSNHHSAENAIHSSIIWSREAILHVNQYYNNKKELHFNDLILLITFIDLLLESFDQINRVLFETDYIDNDSFCFKCAPKLYHGMNNRSYFKEIRALFSAHPVNIREPVIQSKPKKYRYADLPFSNTARVSKLLKREGDFYTRLWTATSNDHDTIYFPIYLNDLFCYAQQIYKRIPIFRERLKAIANHHI